MNDAMDFCEECGQEMDQDCMGNPRCPDCDGPCIYCYSGPGPDEETDNDETDIEKGIFD